MQELHNNEPDGAGGGTVTNEVDVERRVRHFVDHAKTIAESTGIPLADVERALIYDAAKNEGAVRIALDFVFSVVAAARHFVSEWTRKSEQRK
jgi:hypothetical protein